MIGSVVPNALYQLHEKRSSSIATLLLREVAMPKPGSEAHLNAVVVAAGITSYDRFMNQIVDLVEAEMVRSNVSIETLSARTGIKLRLLKTVLRDRHMTLRMLASICVVLGLEPNFRHQDIDSKHLRT